MVRVDRNELVQLELVLDVRLVWVRGNFLLDDRSMRPDCGSTRFFLFSEDK